MMYAHSAGTSGTATVPAGRVVASYTCIAGGSGGTITITPNGGSAQDAITVPASSSFSCTFDLDANNTSTAILGENSTIVFAGTDSYLVVYG